MLNNEKLNAMDPHGGHANHISAVCKAYYESKEIGQDWIVLSFDLYPELRKEMLNILNVLEDYGVDVFALSHKCVSYGKLQTCYKRGWRVVDIVETIGPYGKNGLALLFAKTSFTLPVIGDEMLNEVMLDVMVAGEECASHISVINKAYRESKRCKSDWLSFGSEFNISSSGKRLEILDALKSLEVEAFTLNTGDIFKLRSCYAKGWRIADIVKTPSRYCGEYLAPLFVKMA